ncbi:hypothetical protein MicloDRAFT_00002490 [Microvirga lotononidis]|uniref:Uncharacterized protein n=1 Tax=Microvirga lotononidis TaxID=864069 RepID=I4Z4W7_9HYPH|nr:hypothetical protein MicloDRAFT_00002490 [Microvirga lotononidis]
MITLTDNAVAVKTVLSRAAEPAEGLRIMIQASDKYVEQKDAGNGYSRTRRHPRFGSRDCRFVEPQANGLDGVPDSMGRGTRVFTPPHERR